MRAKILLAVLLFWGLAAHPQNLASPYNQSVFPAVTLSGSGQTSSIIQLNGLKVTSTVGSSYASGTVTLVGTSLTTVTFQVQGSSDNGVTYFPLAISILATPGSTPVATVTATANGLYQVSLAGITHVRFVTSGTFTATAISLTLTASPNASVARSNSSSGGGATIPPTIAVLKGDGNGNGIPAIPGTDFVIPTGNVATATELAGTPHTCTGGQFSEGIAQNGDSTCATPAGGTSNITPGAQVVMVYPVGAPAAQGVPSQFTVSSDFKSFSAPLGDMSAKTHGGTFDAALNQTNPTSNDGILNALSTPGATVVAQEGYAATEDVQAFNFPLFPTGAGGVVPASPWANNTCDFEYRTAYRGTYCNQPLDGQIPTLYTRLNSNFVTQAAGGGIGIGPIRSEWFITGDGKNQANGLGVGNWTIHNFQAFNVIDLSQGISSNLNVSQIHEGEGDTQVANFNLVADAGDPDGSGEAGAVLHLQAFQSNIPYSSVASATLSAGTVIIPTTMNAGTNWPGEGKITVDSTQKGSPLHVTTLALPNTGTNTAGSWTIQETMGTPDTVCRLQSNVATPQLYRGGTTSETFNVSCPSAPITTSSVICVADIALMMESARVTAVGTPSGGIQSVTALLRNPHSAQAYVTQGAHACYGAESLVNEVANGGVPLRIVTREIGHSDTHTILYASYLLGGWTKAPNGAFSTITIPAGTLTRNGSGQVTTVFGTPDPSLSLQGDTIHVVSASDGTYNGTFTSVTQTNTPTQTQLTWSNSGTAGSTTTSGPTYLVVNGVDANSIAEMPAAMMVSPKNPATNGLDGTIVVEAHDWNPTVGDSIEAVSQDENITSISHDDQLSWIPSSASSTQANRRTILHGILPDSENVWTVDDEIPCTDYIGCGGTRIPSAVIIGENGAFANRAPYQYFLNFDPPANDGALFNIPGCGNYACTDPRAFYGLFQLQGNGASYGSSWQAQSNTFSEGVNAPGGNSTNLQITPSGFIFNMNNFSASLGGTNGSVFSDVKDLSGDKTETELLVDSYTTTSISPSSTSNFIQTPSGFSFDQPVTVQGIPVGTAASNPGTCTLNTALDKCLGVTPYLAVAGNWYVAINRALSDLATTGGTIHGCGLYTVTGALQDTSGANTLLLIPSIPSVGAATNITIRFQGCQPTTPNVAALSGMTLQTSVDTSGGNFIAGENGGSFTAVRLVMEHANIISTVTVPHLNLLNASFINAMSLKDVLISGSCSTTPSSNAGGIGLQTPNLSNNFEVTIDDVVVSCMPSGAILREHTQISRLWMGANHDCVTVDGGGTGANSISASMIWAQSCVNYLIGGAHSAGVNIQMFDMETDPGTGLNIDDPSNVISGIVFYKKQSPSGTATVAGGMHLLPCDINAISNCFTPPDITSGLVEYWESQEGSGSTLNNMGSDSTNSAATTAVTWTTATGFPIPTATYNGTTSFAQATSATVTAPTLNGSVPFTACSDINPSTLTGFNTGFLFSNLATGGAPGMAVGVTGSLAATAGTVIFFLRSVAGSNEIIENTSAAITAGVLNKVCLTYDGSQHAAGAHLYVNGTLVPFTAVSADTLTTSAASTQPFDIGNAGPSAQPFTGVEANVRIYSRVLTVPQINFLP